MSTDNRLEEAIEALQQLGLKEYEAECFVGLTRVSTGTAKQLSEITDVPRTRIYDAIRVLEAQGLVEVQHSSPQKFRAVSLEEASETLRDQYENRIERLEHALDDAEPLDIENEDPVQQVWSMVGATAIANRTVQLLDDATEEVVFVVGDDTLLTDELLQCLAEIDSNVDLIVGAATESIQDQIQDAAPHASTFVSGLDWLQEEADSGDRVSIGQLLLIDRTSILVSTVDPETGEAHAVFGGGFKNGLVVIARRLMSRGLIPTRDPGRDDSPKKH